MKMRFSMNKGMSCGSAIHFILMDLIPGLKPGFTKWGNPIALLESVMFHRLKMGMWIKVNEYGYQQKTDRKSLQLKRMNRVLSIEKL